MTRIHYKAASDPKWGEHESPPPSSPSFHLFTVDYLLVVRKDVELHLNSNEVRDARYFSSQDLTQFLTRTDLVRLPLVSPPYSCPTEVYALVSARGGQLPLQVVGYPRQSGTPPRPSHYPPLLKLM